MSPSAGAVILDGPVLPVTKGNDVSLRCRTRNATSAGADFFRDGVLVSSSSTGRLTIRGVSTRDEGLYTCNIPAAGASPGSRLVVTGEDGMDGTWDETPAASLLSITTGLRHMMVAIPYLLSTIVLGLIYRDRKRGTVTVARATRSNSSSSFVQFAIIFLFHFIILQSCRSTKQGNRLMMSSCK